MDIKVDKDLFNNSKNAMGVDENLLKQTKDFLENPDNFPQNQNRYFFTDAQGYYDNLCKINRLLEQIMNTYVPIDVDSKISTAINALREEIESQIEQLQEDIEQDIESLQNRLTSVETDLSGVIDDYLSKTDAQSTYATISSLNSVSQRLDDVEIELPYKQDKLVAGQNITIQQDMEHFYQYIISATGEAAFDDIIVTMTEISGHMVPNLSQSDISTIANNTKAVNLKFSSGSAPLTDSNSNIIVVSRRKYRDGFNARYEISIIYNGLLVKYDTSTTPPTINVIEIGSGSGGGVSSITAGNGLTGGTITSSGTIAVNTSVIQEKLTAGDNITISNNTISASGYTSTLLWENDTPTLSFGYEEIAITGIRNYDRIEICVRGSTSQSWERFFIFDTNIDTTKQIVSLVYDLNTTTFKTTWHCVQRTFSLNSNSITFEVAEYVDAFGSEITPSTSSNYLIPLKIYGIKY